MKIVSILVIGLLLVLLIAGCSQSKDLSANDNSKTVSANDNSQTSSGEQQKIVDQEANDIVDPGEELDLGEMI